MKANKRNSVIAVIIAFVALLLLGFITGCKIKDADSAHSNPSRSLDQAEYKQPGYKKATVLTHVTPLEAGETTTIDGIIVRITVRPGGPGKRGYPERLPLIKAKDKALSKNQVLSWFAPLRAVPDTETKTSLFYPVGSRFYLFDLKEIKRGKVSIDRFDTIYYERIGSDNTVPDQFTFAHGIALVKKFFDLHSGSKPSESYIEQTEAYREKEDMPPDGRHVAQLSQGFHHAFNGIFIQDDAIEVSVSKNHEANYFRRWHDFNTYGIGQPLLAPEELAQQIVHTYKPLWEKQHGTLYKDLLSGKKPLSIELMRLVYYDPRPRDPQQFNSKDAIYRPGWIVRVGAILERKPPENAVNGAVVRDIPSGEEPAYVKVPTLIVDALNGAIYRSKPTGDGLHFREF